MPEAVPHTLPTSDAAYRALFEWASDALFVHDLDTGAIVDANRAACELHGSTLDNLRALGVAGISDGEAPYDAAHAAVYVQRAAAGDPQRFEWVVRRATGERVWVEVRLRRAEVDGVARVLAGVRPIDERKRAEAALRESHDALERRVADRTADLARAEQRFRAIVEASPVPLLLSHARDGVALYANDRLGELVGEPAESLVGRRTLDFYADPRDRADMLERVRAQGYVRDLEVRLRRADGTTRWVSLSIQRLTFNGEPTLATALVDVTERREAAAALRQRTDELEAVFRALPDLYFRMDVDGTIRDYRAGREFGLYAAPEAFLGRRVQDVLPEPVGPKVAAGLAEVAETRGAVQVDYTLPVDDAPHHYEARLLPLGGDQIVGVVRDVTERTRAAEALRASEASYRGLVDSLTDLVYVQDLEGGFVAVNDAVVRAYGYSREELIGQTPLLLSPPGAVDPDALDSLFARVLDGEVVRTDWLAQRKDGSTFTKEIVVQRSTYFGRDVVLAVGRDVTARVEADRALRYQKALLEAQGEASVDGILVVSPDGEVLSYNGRFVEMWAVPPAVVEGGSDAAVHSAVLGRVVDPAAFCARVDELYARPDEAARDEIALRDGRVFDRHTAPVRDAEGEAYGRVWFFRDVTAERRRAADLEAAREAAARHAADLGRSLDELRSAQERLVQQEKMASLGALTAGIAHEIKNPLNFVNNFAALTRELADEAAAEPDPAERETLLADLRSNAEKIEAHGKRADAIVRSMMAHARSGGARRTVDLNALAEETAALALHGLRARQPVTEVDVDLDLSGAVGQVEAVPDDLVRVLVNLLDNAFDAIRERGATDDGYVPTVSLSTRREGDAVVVRVADNGTGMPAEVRDRVFEPFYTTKPTGQGTGLGLSLSYDVVTRGHGGTLVVESEEGRGTTFTVSLPTTVRPASGDPIPEREPRAAGAEP